jgi:hypothetical protein
LASKEVTASLSKKFIETLEIEEGIKKRLHLEFTVKDDHLPLRPVENVLLMREKRQHGWFEATSLKAK